MEKTSKMITAAVVLVLCAVAVIGVGYAYIATTENSGNNAVAEYIVLTQGGNQPADYTFINNDTLATYDTVTKVDGEAVKTTYKLNTTDFNNTTAVPDYKVRQIGKAITLHTTQTNGTWADRTCTVTASGFDYEENMAMFLVIVNNNTTTTLQLDSTGQFKTSDASTFTIAKKTNSNEYYDTTITLYYGFSVSQTPTPAETNTPPAPTTIQNAKLTFSLTATPTPSA